MYAFVLTLHIVVAIVLVAVILIQRGRSGGLVESLGGVESIFGTKTSSLFVKLTAILAVIFFLTSIFLAYLYRVEAERRDRPLIETQQPFEEPVE